MSSLLPVAPWSLHLSPDTGPVLAVDVFPASVRILLGLLASLSVLMRIDLIDSGNN